jgi:hypothetical protein
MNVFTLSQGWNTLPALTRAVRQNLDTTEINVSPTIWATFFKENIRTVLWQTEQFKIIFVYCPNLVLLIIFRQ